MPLTGVVISINLGLYVPMVLTPKRERMFGSRCSMTSRQVIASYPSILLLYLSIPPIHNSVCMGSHRGRCGGKVEDEEGGVSTARADEMTPGEGSIPPNRFMISE